MNQILAIYERRDAFKQLVLKSFRVRYRNMALGVLWSVINPLVMLGVLAFIFTHVYPSQDPTIHYPTFLLIGLVHFNAFGRMLPSATGSVREHSSIIKKVAFPRIIVPLAVVVAQLVDVAILMLLLLGFTLIFGIPVTPLFLWVLVALAIELVFVAGVGMACSALNVYYRDMMYLVESWLTVLFWLTPVFYSLSVIRERLPEWAYRIYLLNPLAGCIETSRRAILYQTGPDWQATGTALVVALVVFGAGLFTFQRLQRGFADLT